MLYPTTVNSLILNNNSSTKAIVGLLLLITKLELPIASIIQPRSMPSHVLPLFQHLFGVVYAHAHF